MSVCPLCGYPQTPSPNGGMWCSIYGRHLEPIVRHVTDHALWLRAVSEDKAAGEQRLHRVRHLRRVS